MTSSGRYDTSGYPEDQYEPGSDGTVLKNLLGITSREDMVIVETEQNVGCGSLRLPASNGNKDLPPQDLSNRRVDLVEF